MKLLLRILLALLILTVYSCVRDTDDATDITPQEEMILRVKGSDRLYTTEYVIHKVVSYDDIVRLKGTVFSQKFDLKLPQGDRKVLIPMEARVKAYIDFSKFGPENVTFHRDSTITVTLPDPTIVLTSTKIDHAGVRTFVDMGRSRFTSAELSDFEQQGRAAILASIPQMGIEETAREHAYNFLLPLIEGMGYKPSQITVNFRKDFSDDDYLNKLIQNPLD